MPHGAAMLVFTVHTCSFHLYSTLFNTLIMLHQSPLQKTHQPAQSCCLCLGNDMLFHILCYVLNQTRHVIQIQRKIAWQVMITHLQQVRRHAAIDRCRSATIKFNETAPTCRDFRLARGGIGGLYETSKMKIGV